MDVRLPDGTIIQGVPDGTTKKDLVARLQKNGVAVPSEWLDSAPAEAPKQASAAAGEALRQIPRQVGLTARYGLEGLGQLADVVTEPVRHGLNALTNLVRPKQTLSTLVTGESRPDLFPTSTSQQASGLANALGLPSPETADERVIGDATRNVVGVAGGAAAAGRAAANAAPGIARNALQAFAANPGTQVAGAAGAGLAGGSVREAGGGELQQLGASVLGGVAGGSVVNAAANVAAAVGRQVAKRLPGAETRQIQAADQQIQLILERSGVDWSQVPERVRQGMRQEVASAMNTGQPLSPDALRRLLVFKETGTTPTVGMLTQDPGQITREMNLAKTGANSTDASLQRLPSLQNQNVQALLRRLDEAGAANAPNAFATGQKVIDSLQASQDAAKNNINALYSAARDTAGRSLPMNGNAFTKSANQALDEAMVGGALPPGVAATMNKIATGEMPFTVEIAEQIKTQIGKLQRATSDGQQRYALGLVRKALDDTPIVGAERVNPGNLPAVNDTVPPSVGSIGDEALQAFSDARKANAQWMARVEANPALKAVVDGAEPDQFVKKFIIGQGATAKDLQQLKAEIGPDAVQAIRQNLVAHLKDAATNSTDDVAKFSNDAYRKALRNLGDEKMAAFFSADELRQLRNIGEAGKYMQAQPAGSAVNNSNSGALVLGRGLDVLDKIAQNVPFGFKDVISGRIQGVQQTQVLTPRNALAAPLPRQGQRINPLLAATIATPVQGREDDRSDYRP